MEVESKALLSPECGDMKRGFRVTIVQLWMGLPGDKCPFRKGTVHFIFIHFIQLVGAFIYLSLCNDAIIFISLPFNNSHH